MTIINKPKLIIMSAIFVLTSTSVFSVHQSIAASSTTTKSQLKSDLKTKMEK